MNRRFIGKIMKWTLLSLACVILAIICVTPWQVSQAAPTKTTAFDTIDAWQALAATGFAVGNAEDISGSYSTLIYIEIALTDTDAQDGVQVAIEVSYADDDWMLWWGPVTGTAETPATTTLDGQANVTDATIDLVDAGTGDFDDRYRKWFIVDGTVANSESVRTASETGNTVTLCQDLMRTHATGLNAWDRVDEWTIAVPLGAAYVRVLVNNVDANADIHWRSFCSKVTGL